MASTTIQTQQIPLDFDASPQADDSVFNLNIKRSPKRRTIEIIVRNGVVDLMLPQFVSTLEGMSFVRSKEAWIYQTLAKQEALENEREKKHYIDGEFFTLLGKPFELQLFLTGKPSTQLVNGKLYVGIRERLRGSKQEAVRKQVWTWYQQQALRILSEKTLALATQIKREVTDVKLRRTKTKWGHCTSEGVIQYNWQIVVAPEPVIDYLVAHEVSHLVHHHHGKRFWRHVEKLCPDYLEHEKWLKRNGHTIEL